MPSINREVMGRILAFLFFFWACSMALHFAYAQEGAEAAAPATAAEQKAVNQDFAQYNKHINKISQLRGKVEEAEKRIQQLIIEKRMGRNPEIPGLITEAYKDYSDNRDKYESEVREVTYRYPSKGQEIRRKYRPYRAKTVMQLEKELGLNGQLSDLRNKVDEKYRAIRGDQPKPAPEASPESTVRQPASARQEGHSKRLKLRVDD